MLLLSGYLVICNQEQPSAIYMWDASVGLFNESWTGPPTIDLYPLEVNQPEVKVVTLLEAPLLNTSVFDVRVLQVERMDVATSDFVPRSLIICASLVYLTLILVFAIRTLC